MIRRLTARAGVRGVVALCVFGAVAAGTGTALAKEQPRFQPTRFAEVDLVSDQAGKAALTDPLLVNSWGLAESPTLAANSVLLIRPSAWSTERIFRSILSIFWALAMPFPALPNGRSGCFDFTRKWLIQPAPGAFPPGLFS